MYYSEGFEARKQADNEGKQFDLMPYGMWTTGEGREVLFNRAYLAIYERTPTEPVKRADPWQWVHDVVAEKWFYDDGYSKPQRHNIGIAVLKEWEVI